MKPLTFRCGEDSTHFIYPILVNEEGDVFMFGRVANGLLETWTCEGFSVRDEGLYLEVNPVIFQYGISKVKELTPAGKRTYIALEELAKE